MGWRVEILAMPELADLNVVQSCRGYAPMAISHYQANLVA
jgi:hypothetical protein